MRFIADMMLGRLARWLRLYGHDTLYGVEADEDILRIALAENRVLLTRDSGLAGRARKLGMSVILLTSNSLEGQMEELRGSGVEFKELFPASARCPKCNGPIKRVSKEEIRGRVPEAVYERYDGFYVCENCGQVYWPGRQWKEMLRMDKKLRKINQ
ncbi:Mut7-C RNAse domain-containing protein [Thermococcus sp. JdF3]|uniref:Mut7-C RNAse domain-containing protein n=1 Tax=Thermococcus sp. JdF3 TaxID=1638258 RepID=UPI0014391198|nr:Mut7-C RNAse domain-containing protein [Thermococcus sp. JdF3]NJE01559.1 hypothetical protein [Thermococcus sp. JdF3]